MNITIRLSKKEVNHIMHCNTACDACGIVEDIIDKVKKVVRKQKEGEL